MLGFKIQPQPRRSTKPYSNSKAARSSHLSLGSRGTAFTEASGGSGSTITQKSYLRSINTASPDHRRKSRRTSHQRSTTDRYSTTTAARKRSAKVDVFDFMVKDEHSKDKRKVEKGEIAHDDEDGKAAIDKGDIIRDRPEDFYKCTPDSGLGDSTYGSLSGSVKDQGMPELPEGPHSRPLSPQFSHGQPGGLAPFDPRWHWDTSSPIPPPFPYHVDSYIPPPCPPPPPAVPGFEFSTYYPDAYTGLQAPPPLRSANYELAFDVRKPMGTEDTIQHFRSFTKLSTQLLLQMQNDIAELESELEAFDVEVENSSRSDLQDSKDRPYLPQRAEICQELHLKLDQYYQALATRNKIEATSRSVSSSELDIYRQWLLTRVTPTSRVIHLTKDDVRVFDLSSTASHPILPTNSLALAFGASIYALLPLLSFRLVSGILNRLSILTLFAICGFTAQDRIGIAVTQIEQAYFMVLIVVSTMAAIVL